jgi:antitoxin CptB
MSGTILTSADLDPRRRKALFRAWHRGTREMDLILGGYADRNLARMSETELSEFEALMDVADPKLFTWVTGKALVEHDYDTPTFRKIRADAVRPQAVQSER